MDIRFYSSKSMEYLCLLIGLPDYGFVLMAVGVILLLAP